MTVKDTDYVGGLWEEFRGNRAVDQTGIIERFYLRWITELAVNRFTWTGLPEEPEGDLRPRYMELMLFRKAMVVFFRHKKFEKYLCLQGTYNGNLDMYFDPTSFNIYGNGTVPQIDGLTVSHKDAVPIWANMLRAPDLDMVSIYVKRLAKFDRTVDINVLAMQHPFIISATDEQRHTIVEAYRQVQDGQPVLMLNKNVMGADDITKTMTVLDMKLHPDTITNLMLDKKKIWQECMTFLGINNANQEKRERLITDEVNANNSEVGAARAIALNARQQACEAINKKFGLDIWCEWNAAVDNMGKTQDEVDEEAEKAQNQVQGVNDGGNIHDNDQESD